MLASFFPYSETWISWILFWCVTGVLLVVALLPKFGKRHLAAKSYVRTLPLRAIAFIAAILAAWMVAGIAFLAPVYGRALAREGSWSGYAMIGLFCAGLLASGLVVLFYSFKQARQPRRPMTLRTALIAWCAIGGLVGMWYVWGRYCYNRLEDEWEVNQNQAHLRLVGYYLDRYHREQGRYPDDLWQLNEEGGSVPLLSSVRYLEDLAGLTIRHSDFQYVRLPSDAPADLVWVWLPSELNNRKRALALYKGGQVARCSPGALAAEIERTRQWLESR